MYQNAALGFSLRLPSSSELLDDLPDAAVVAVDRGISNRAFRANIVVTIDEDCPFTDIESYTDAAIAIQGHELEAFRLLDRAPATLEGGLGTRTLSHHSVNEQPVTAEQWRLLEEGRAITVTASCWTLDYHVLADVFAACAETLVMT
jgi:hypothetical protein